MEFLTITHFLLELLEAFLSRFSSFSTYSDHLWFFSDCFNADFITRLFSTFNFFIWSSLRSISFKKKSFSSSYFERETFSAFLNDLRIGHACKLLIEDELNVTQVCYESGFNNISYFNRQFKKMKNKNPLKYRNEFHLKNQM